MNAGTAVSAGDALVQGGLVTVAGLGTVFLVLILLVLMTMLLGVVIKKLGIGAKQEKKKEEAVQNAPAPVPVANRSELSAVIAASIATAMGTNVTGLRIHSIKKISR